jgi:hypothetical protein
MEKILAKLELWGNCIRVRVWTWPDRRDLLRARLSASPQHGRAALELLESVARWEGRPVHAAVVVDESACSTPSQVFPDLLPETTPLVECDYVAHRVSLYRERSALHLRGHGREEPRLPPMLARGWTDAR